MAIFVALGFGSGWTAGQNNLKSKGGVDLGLPKKLVNVGAPSQYQEIDFSLFWDTWARMEKDYYDPEKLDPEKMVYGAIEGMVASAGDPYTVFLPPQEQQRAEEDLSGAFEGVGIQLGYRDERLAVMAPLKGMPAEKAGIKAGDYILNIKDVGKNIDVDTNRMSLPEAVDLIRGEHATQVTLTLFRENNGGKPFDVTMSRDTILVPSVVLSFVPASGMKDDTVVDQASYPGGSVALLSLSRFGERTQDEWNEAVAKILARSDLKGTVLDLRNNPGGYLDGAIFVAGEFISDGVVVKQQGRNDSQSYSVNRKGKLIGKPLTVLINGGSASASEIVAGALRDRLQTKLVGEKSFGKGTVQSVVDLPGGTGMHITTSRWLLPAGSWIHETGIEPDVEATDSADTLADEQLNAAIEAL